MRGAVAAMAALAATATLMFSAGCRTVPPGAMPIEYGTPPLHSGSNALMSS